MLSCLNVSRRLRRFARLSLPGCVMTMSLMCVARQTNADDWPVPQHDAGNTCYSADLLKPPLRLAWRVATNDRVGFLLADGNAVCVSSTSVRLYDSTGKLTWTVPQAKALYLNASILLVVSRTPHAQSIDCYDRRTRTRTWSYSLPAATEYWFAVSKTGSADELSFTTFSDNGGYRPTLFILSLRDGRLQRTAQNADAQASDGSYIYWGAGHWFHVVDVATLKSQWGFYDGGGVPVVAGSTVVGHGWGNWATAIDVRRRVAIWRNQVWRDSIHTLLHTSTGRVLILEATSVPIAVAAFALDENRMVWQHAMFCETFNSASQAVGSGHYGFVAGWHEHLPSQKTPRGGFYCLDADTGAERWKYERLRRYGRAVIISAGYLYGIDNQGDLYKFVTAIRR